MADTSAPQARTSSDGAGTEVCTLMVGSVAQMLRTADIRIRTTVSDSRAFFILQFSFFELGAREASKCTPPQGRSCQMKTVGSALLDSDYRVCLLIATNGSVCVTARCCWRSQIDSPGATYSAFFLRNSMVGCWPSRHIGNINCP